MPGMRGAVRSYVHLEIVGKHKVSDATARVPQCLKCDAPELTLRDLAGYQRRAAALVLREVTAKVEGDVMRYARKAIGLRQVDLAKLLGYAPETLSRWETGDQDVPRAARLALVAVLEGVEQQDGDVDAFLAGESSDRPVPRNLEVPQVRRVG